MKFLNLRTRILLALVILLVFLGGTIAALIKTTSSHSLRRELEKRGVSIAMHIARNSVGSILARDPLALRLAAGNQKKAEEDIVYIFFLGTAPDEVLGHSFGDEFPLALLHLNPLEAGRDYSICKLATETGPVYDIAVPVAGGGLGTVRLGISALPVEQAVSKLTGEIILMTLLTVGVGIVFAFPLATTIVRPVQRLTRATEAVADGRLAHEVPEGGMDEIGLLAKSFNRMVRNLRQAREDLLRTNRELAQEVTRRQQAEASVSAQLNFLSTLLDQLPCPVWFKDREGRYLGCNRAFEEFLGRSRDRIIGLRVSDLLPEDEADRHAQMDQQLEEKSGACRYEETVTRADGAIRQVVIHKTFFNGGDGRVSGAIGILLDMTSEWETERIRSEFISMAAHEFQTPLTAILGYCELLLESIPAATGSWREYLETIQERAEFLSRMVHQLLDFSRLEAGCGIPVTRAPLQIENLVARCVHAFTRQVTSHRFEMHLPSQPSLLPADEDRLGQVLENLLSNAVKYSPKGSVVQIRGEVGRTAYQVSVIDQGIGLTAEQCERIFDKFYRVNRQDSAPSGSGLGLYISRSIIEAHQGTMEVASQPGKGTRLSFSLPLS